MCALGAWAMLFPNDIPQNIFVSIKSFWGHVTQRKSHSYHPLNPLYCLFLHWFNEFWWITNESAPKVFPVSLFLILVLKWFFESAFLPKHWFYEINKFWLQTDIVCNRDIYLFVGIEINLLIHKSVIFIFHFMFLY